MPDFPKSVIKAAAIFAAALALRLAVTFDLTDLPLHRTPQLDSLEYLSWARLIAAGHFHWPYAPTHGPGYPGFLGFLLAWSGPSLGFAHFVQSVLGALTCTGLFFITRKLHDDRAAIAAGVLSAAYGPLLLVDTSLLAEGLFLFLLTAALVVLVHLHPVDLQRRRLLLSVLAGLLLGMAAITRPTALILIPLMALEVFRRTRSAPPVLAFVLALGVPITPVVLSNWQTTGRFMAIQSAGGVNFYIANSPRDLRISWTRPGGEWDSLRGAAWRAGIHDPAAEDAFYSQRAFAEISADPLRFLRLLAIKSFWTVQADEIRDSHSLYFFKLFSPTLALAPGFGLLLPAALMGLAVLVRDRRLSFLLAGFAFLMLCSVTGLIVGMRYRLPLLLPMFVFAGVGIGAVLGAVQARDRKGLSFLLSLGLLGFLVSHLGRHDSTHDFAEEWALNGIASISEGRLDTASESVQRAIALNPRHGLSWRVLGDISVARGAWSEAETAYRKAIAVDPFNVRALAHLALVHLQRGDRVAARSLLERANGIKAEDEVLTNLARLEYVDGRYARAEQLLVNASRRTHGDAGIHTGLALVASARGDFATAVDEAKRALELDPSQGQAADILLRATRTGTR